MPKWVSIKQQCNVIEITLRHGCSPVNFLHIFKPPFLKNTSGGLLPKLRFNPMFLSHMKYILSYLSSISLN